MRREDPRRDGAWLGSVDSRIRAVLALLGLALTHPAAPAHSAPPSFTEDFTTTAYKDTAQTTAEWDTTAGEVRLYPFVPGVVGSADSTGSAVGVVVAGDVAYIAAGSGGVQVFDITDPTQPFAIGGYTTIGNADAVFVEGDYLYVAAEGQGLVALDISDPTSPTLAGNYDTGGFSFGVYVSGNHAYVADGSAGLIVVDVTDPTSPSLAGSYGSIASAHHVFVDGDHAFVSDWIAGVVVIDISDPTSPSLAGSYATSNAPQEVFVSGDLAFVSASELLVLDITDPTMPSLLGSEPSPAFGRGLYVDGNWAYVSDASGGCYSIDVTDPTMPVLEDTYTLPSGGWDVVVAGDHAFVAGAASGLLVVEVSLLPTNFAPVGSFPSLDATNAVVVAGDHAFLADGSAGLRIVDITDLSNPVLAGAYDTPLYALSLAVSGNHAYVGDGYNVLILDVSDPTNPSLADSIPTASVTRGLAVAGDFLYVANDEAGLKVIDVSDPFSPALAGSVDTPGSAWDVAVAGDHAFVADYEGGLQIVDIEDPTVPSIAGSFPRDFATHVAVSGDLLFLTDDLIGLNVFDISNPAGPLFRGSSSQLTGAYDVFASGDQVFVTGQSGLVAALDITDPEDAFVTGGYSTCNLLGLAVAGEHAFLAAGSCGLEIIQVRQREFAPSPGYATSLPFDGEDEIIPRVRITPVQTAGVSWVLSSDGGLGYSLVPVGAWTRMTFPGSDLLWQSFHAWTPGVNPTVSQVTIEWLREFAPVTNITDVPDDQGGFVRIALDRSGYDFADEPSTPVTGYQIYQRVDSQALIQELEDAGKVPDPRSLEGSALVSFDPARVRTLGSRAFVTELSTAGTFPPGTWEAVAWVAATQSDEYLVRVPTRADSGAAGANWSVYLTTTHTTTPSSWFASDPDSGYSLDNIAPAAPSGLAFGGGGVLQWNPAPEPDFEYHSVYGSESGIFDETATLIGNTVNPTFDVSAESFAAFHVTTSDHAGNESGAASISSTISIPGEAVLPTRFALHAAQPNPFRTGTRIVFELPSPASTRLTIFDASGRRVRELENHHYEPGRYEVLWDGRDQAGRLVPSGIYFARLVAGAFLASQRIVALK